MNIDFHAPAFPVPQDAEDDGMTLRDWFAGQALSGVLIATATVGRMPVDNAATASIVYELADALMEERQRR